MAKKETQGGRFELEGCRGSVGDRKPGTGRKEEEDRSEETEKTSWRKRREREEKDCLEKWGR